MRKILLTVCLAAVLTPSQAFAKNISLDIGRSDIFTTKEKIDTIFVSNPNIADYKVLDDNKFIIYAKNNGRSDITVLNEEGKVLVNDTLLVKNDAHLFEANVAGANKAIKFRFPNSNLKVKKIGKAYIIEGIAKSNQELDNVINIVGTAVDTPSKQKITVGVGSNNTPDFLEKSHFNNVINNAIVEQATQINVKLTVVEVSKDLTQALGIKWNHLGNTITDGLNNIVKTTVSGGFSGGSSSINITSNKMTAFINALDDKKNTKVLAEPNISMLSGEASNVLIGGQVPLMQHDADGNPTVSYKDFGIRLDVGAKIQKNNRIRLALQQEISSLGNNVGTNNISMPIINTRSSRSTFEVADGESFIIGGLYNSNQKEGLSKTPLLGDIPILGAFFRSTNTAKSEKELVIVATVQLVKPVQETDIVYPNFESTGTLERFFFTKPLTDVSRAVYYRTLTTNFLQRGGFIQ